MSQRIRIGDVLAIPLDNGRFAFCRVLKDASIGIYDYSVHSQDMIPSSTIRYLFVVGVYRHVLTSGEWPLVLRQPFQHEEDAWPPPQVVHDVISGGVSIYHKGVMRPASTQECEGLEPAAIWDREQILSRLTSLGLARKMGPSLRQHKPTSEGSEREGSLRQNKGARPNKRRH